MNYTPNYNLVKPDQDDFYNIDEFHNSSMDIIDGILYSLEKQVSSLSSFDIKGVVPTYADLPDPYTGEEGDVYLVQADETHDGKAAAYEYIGGLWIYLADFAAEVTDPPVVVYIQATTGVNTYAAASDIEEYKTGAVYAVTFSSLNTGAVTLNIAGLGAKSVLSDNNVQLKTGEILAGSTHLLVDTGAQFKILSQRAVLSAAQLASPLTGLLRNLASASDITSSDSPLTAFGKALTLSSAITGYVAGTDAALVSTDVLRTALGKLQGQINGLRSRIPYLGTTAGAMPAYTAALTDARVTGLVTGAMYSVIFHAANNSAAAPTINITINGAAQGAKAIVDGNNVAVKQNAIAANSAHLLMWDGVRFKIISQEDVFAATLTNYVLGADTPVANTDNLLAMLGKFQGQTNNRVKKTGDTMSGRLALLKNISIGGDGNGASNAGSNYLEFLTNTPLGGGANNLHTGVRMLAGGMNGWNTAKLLVAFGTSWGKYSGNYEVWHGRNVPDLPAELSKRITTSIKSIQTGNFNYSASNNSFEGGAIEEFQHGAVINHTSVDVNKSRVFFDGFAVDNTDKSKIASLFTFNPGTSGLFERTATTFTPCWAFLNGTPANVTAGAYWTLIEFY